MRECRRRVWRAQSDLAHGRPIVLRDDLEDIACLVIDAGQASSRSVTFLVRHTSGFLTAAAPAQVWQRLRVPPSPSRDDVDGLLDFGVSVDAVDTGTGISAQARAATLRRLADPDTQPHDLVRPGHVMTVRVGPAGLAADAALPAVACELVRCSGTVGPIVAGYAHLVGASDPCGVATAEDGRSFADEFELSVVDVSDVQQSAHPRAPSLNPVPSAIGGRGDRRDILSRVPAVVQG